MVVVVSLRFMQHKFLLAPDVVPCKYLLVQLLHMKARDVAAATVRCTDCEYDFDTRKHGLEPAWRQLVSVRYVHALSSRVELHQSNHNAYF
jgi:hypothetical protein